VIGERTLRAVLIVTAAYHVALGALALFAPDTFFDQIGRYGVENSHYVGDVGAFMLAFGVAVGISVVRPAWRPPILWLGALWYGFMRSTTPSTRGRRRARRAVGATRS
jgi:hypothetical protein